MAARVKLLALIALVGGALAAVLRRRRSSGSAASGSSPTPPSPPVSEAPASDVVTETWACECGQEYRVSGEGRHRVYWPAEAPVSDPTISGDCVKCDRPLPDEHEPVAPAD